MRRRRFMQAIAAAPAVPLAAQQAATTQAPATPPARGRGMAGGPEILEVVPADNAGETVARFFTPVQFAALRRLAALIEPPMRGNPGAVECNAPEFIDFLIGISPADRQQLYRNGLDTLNSHAKKQFSKTFADLDDEQAHAIVKPMLVAVPWPKDPPKDPLLGFMFAVREDIPTATRNSPEYAAAAEKAGRRVGGGGMVWNPIDPVYRG